MNATGATLTSNSSDADGAVIDGPNARLAELVVHLSDCPAPAAVAAVNEAAGDTPPASDDERLHIVARALVSVRRHIDLRDHAKPAE